jgi:myo-inositol-1(or 4)-monophosphatase
MGAGLTQELLEMATSAAHQAGALLLDRFGGPAKGVDTKTSPTDLVSDADRDAEELVLRVISAARPGDGILAEEGSGRESQSGITWIIDPLDGTVNYLYGIPVWSVSIAAADERGAVVGVVHDPNRSETHSAVRGDGARLNDGRTHVTDQADLSQALIGTGFSYESEVRAIQAARVAEVLPRVRDIRRAGSAALDLASVACGRLDGFYEAAMQPWDRAAGVLLVEEAGGLVSDLPAPLGLSTGVIAAGPRLHPHLVELILG